MIECIYVDTPFPDQPPEVEIGNKEYKRYFSFRYLKQRKVNSRRVQEKLNQRASQMLYRIHEGDGKALYLFGVDDNGTVVGLDKEKFKDTLFYLEKIVNLINAEIKSIKVYPSFKDCERHVITCRILRKLN